MAARPSRASRSSRLAPRIESDSIGDLEVPKRALYGIHTVRSIRNLGFSGRTLGRYPAYVRALAIVKKAAARANREASVLDQRLSKAIEAACDELIAGEHLDQFPVDVLGGGGGIAVNLNINEVIANLANESLGGARGIYKPVHPKLHVNASQSTADVCHTASRIAIIDRWAGLRSVLDACIDVARAKAKQFHSIQTIARTCLRDASAVSLGEIFGAHASAIERRAAEIDRAVMALRRINLGATAIGDGGGAPPLYRRAVLAHLNQLSKMKLTRRANLFDAAQNIDDLAAVAAQLALLAEVLIKIAQDLRLLSSGPEGGYGEIELPAVQEGSSFFPGKINPVIPETLLQCCFQVLGCERAARIGLERGELNLNIFEGSAAINVMDAIAMLERSVSVFTELCLRGITANEARCRQLAAVARRRNG
ncbi:MAG TPA: lyase family protein [Candidatus Binataceae bacterium]|nr:lyase family protein [Candidatus Binataceae bacterium]